MRELDVLLAERTPVPCPSCYGFSTAKVAGSQYYCSCCGWHDSLRDYWLDQMLKDYLSKPAPATHNVLRDKLQELRAENMYLRNKLNEHLDKSKSKRKYHNYVP